jgi:hypothetical protein
MPEWGRPAEDRRIAVRVSSKVQAAAAAQHAGRQTRGLRRRCARVVRAGLSKRRFRLGTFISLTQFWQSEGVHAIDGNQQDVPVTIKSGPLSQCGVTASSAKVNKIEIRHLRHACAAGSITCRATRFLVLADFVISSRTFASVLGPRSKIKIERLNERNRVVTSAGQVHVNERSFDANTLPSNVLVLRNSFVLK